ncbi:DUF4097 family beta strand repeat protein [Actinomadura sp. NAK00032]|uniref:DUF4097 family beta strand repeat-containing protein n=1 Tax=Actinomadura sp. NAK00032 TaxID=2742128 RepID=UPI0015912C0A|nr:DUF4097 family beta strand repeat-containing protein [Actinomadura sp. NAK00032]QKW40025.1 DUF4097 family beta strand repeat protein [Actinomadura sp. NAK00032]
MSISSRRALPLAAGALLVTASLAGCGASAADATPEQRAFGPVGTRLTIAKDAGDLDIRPADVSDVRVTRRFDRWSVIGGKPSATWKLSGDRLTLATDCDTLIGGCDVRYEVLVPKGLAVGVEGQNGTISATGFNAALRVRSANGAIVVDGAAGPLDLRSENGELRASATRSQEVSARSQSGKVDLSFAAAPRRVAVTTENGEVRVTVPRAPYKVSTATESGDVRADVPAEASSPRSISARTESGSITLRTPGG